jgi:hypothetical protein
MNWTGRAWRMGCAIAILALAACGTGPAPNDVSEGVGFQDYQEYQARRAALRAPQPVAPQTALPPASVVAEPFAPEPPATSQWVAVDPAQTARTGSVDVARIAAGAIAEAEGTIPAPATAPVAVSPTEMATAPTGDDFVAPPLPEGMSVVGATVVAFALTTQHAVGERVYSRFPLRLGRREVQCSRLPHHRPRAGLVPDQRGAGTRPRGPRPRRGRLRLQLVARTLPGRGARRHATRRPSARFQDG